MTWRSSVGRSIGDATPFASAVARPTHALTPSAVALSSSPVADVRAMRVDPHQQQQVQHHRNRVRRDDDAFAHPRITSCCSTPRPSSSKSERAHPPRLFRRLRPREHRPDIDNDVDEAHSFSSEQWSSLAMLKVTTPPHPQRPQTRKRSHAARCARVGRQRHVDSITCDERGTSTSFAARRRSKHCHRATASEHSHAPHPEAASAVQRPTPPTRATLSIVVSSGSAMRHHATQLHIECHEHSRRGCHHRPVQ